MMVFFSCWGWCPSGMLTPNNWDDGEKWDIKINDVPVTNLTDIGNDALVVHHADGITFPQDTNGGYKLEFHVKMPGYYSKIFAIMIF
jgi:hypothetical protein